jgi:hypothetical protein
MTPDATPRIVSRHIHERQTAPSTAPVPKARPWRRGQAPKPHSGAPKAQGLTAAIAVAAPSLGPSIEPDNPVSLNATGANAPMNAFATSRIYTSLTDATLPSTLVTASAPEIRTISRLNGWPARTPTDASPTPCRMPAHGSEPTWFATPSSQWTLTTSSLPVSRRTTRCSRESGGDPSHSVQANEGCAGMAGAGA